MPPIMTTHETKLMVRYSETDQMGRVYYSRYLEWFELGRAEPTPDTIRKLL